jgi:predicted phosphodiesterase
MPKTALISDIHANIDALEAVLADIDQQGINEILCLGDIVGYGAAPAECLRILRKRCSAFVIGNHDAYTLLSLDKYQMEKRVRDGILFAQQALTKEEKKWIRSLPLTAEVGPITIVHASLHNPDSFYYLGGRVDFLQHFDRQRNMVSFFGHTHRPEVALLRNEADVGFGIPGEGEVLLEGDKACAINERPTWTPASTPLQSSFHRRFWGCSFGKQGNDHPQDNPNSEPSPTPPLLGSFIGLSRVVAAVVDEVIGNRVPVLCVELF